MKNKSKLTKRNAKGFTIVEAAMAMVVLTVVALGALSYEYLAVRHNSIAREDLVAARIAQLLIDDWKSTGGSKQYDPTELKIGITEAQDTGGKVPVDYTIFIDGIHFFIKLKYSDIKKDKVADTTLRKLIANVYWRRDHIDSEINVNDPSLTVITYTRLDSSGG